MRCCASPVVAAAYVPVRLAPRPCAPGLRTFCGATCGFWKVVRSKDGLLQGRKGGAWHPASIRSFQKRGHLWESRRWLRKKPGCGVARHPSSRRRTSQYASLLGLARLASGLFAESPVDFGRLQGRKGGAWHPASIRSFQKRGHLWESRWRLRKKPGCGVAHRPSSRQARGGLYACRGEAMPC